MKNYLQPGKTLDLLAPYDVLSGAGALVGSIFGVAAADYLSGVLGEFDVVGCFQLKKAASQAWTVGIKIYWDDTAKGTTSVSTSNTFIGHAIEAVGSGAGEVLGKVRLHGCPQ